MNDFEYAREYLNDNALACLVVKDGQHLYESKARGIFPLYEAHVMQNIDMVGSALADKVIGKAAAMIAVEAGVASIHAIVISDHAIQYFDEHGIDYAFEKRTAYIKNRELNGMCPVETRALESNDYLELIVKVEDFLKSINAI
jgi:hypothetical protein